MPDAPHLLEVLLATVGALALKGGRAAVEEGRVKVGHRRADRVKVRHVKVRHVKVGRVRLRQDRVEPGLVERDRVHLNLEGLDLEDLDQGDPEQVLEGRVVVMAEVGTSVAAVLGPGPAEPPAAEVRRPRGPKAVADQ